MGDVVPETTKPNSVVVFLLVQYTSLSMGEKEVPGHTDGQVPPGISPVVGSATISVCLSVQNLRLQSS